MRDPLRNLMIYMGRKPSPKIASIAHNINGRHSHSWIVRGKGAILPCALLELGWILWSSLTCVQCPASWEGEESEQEQGPHDEPRMARVSEIKRVSYKKSHTWLWLSNWVQTAVHTWDLILGIWWPLFSDFNWGRITLDWAAFLDKNHK